MNCPKCGKELKDGHMYCEECGGEINLVPEFEAEVEESIATSIKSVVDKAEITMPDIQTPKKHWVGFVLISGFFAIVIFFLTAFGVGGYTVWDQSDYFHELLIDYHLEKKKN